MELNVTESAKKATELLDQKSPKILVGVGLVGFLATMVMVAKAAPKAKEAVEEAKEELVEIEEDDDENAGKYKTEVYLRTTGKVAWIYGRAVLLGCTSAFCILKASSIQSKRLVAAVTAFQMSDEAYKAYREKAVEIFGKKEEKIRDEVNADKVRNSQRVEDDIYRTGNGETLCLDALTGRYFYSTPEAVHRAENRIYKLLLDEMYVSLNEYYDEVGLERVDVGDYLGWDCDEPIELRITSTLTEDERPCLVVGHLNPPKYDYASRKFY